MKAQQKVKKVVIPVAGLGTRGLPFTKEVPKEMLPIIDTPTIHYIVEEVLAAGIEQIVFVTSKGKSALEDYFDPSPNLVAWLHKRGKDELADRIELIGRRCEVISVRQKDPLGLGHAIYCARNIVGNESFAVCLGDEIFPTPVGSKTPSPLVRLVEAANRLNTSMVGVVEIPPEDSRSYGVIDTGGAEFSGDEPMLVKRTVEKPEPSKAPSRFAIIGRYVFESSLMDYLKDLKPGAGGELQLTDGMDKLAERGHLHAILMTGPRYDIGNHFFYIKAQLDEALRRPELASKVREYLKTL